ncbi:MAG: GerMN domain-containing protein, partial [Actinobacteria bacterium]|nr:GerMN domain-containing protein [Actinomycetota bacterium]
MKVKKNVSKIKILSLFLSLIFFLFFSILTLNSCIPVSSDRERSIEDEVTKEVVESESVDEKDLTALSEESGKSEEEGTEQTAETSISTEVEKDNESVKEELGVFVYFADENGEFLVGELRYVPRDDYLIQSILELLKGPDADNLISLIPPTTKLINVELVNGIAKVYFSNDFVEKK